MKQERRKKEVGSLCRPVGERSKEHTAASQIQGAQGAARSLHSVQTQKEQDISILYHRGKEDQTKKRKKGQKVSTHKSGHHCAFVWRMKAVCMVQNRAGGYVQCQ